MLGGPSFSGFSYLGGGGQVDDYRGLKPLTEEEDLHIHTDLLRRYLREDSPEIHTLKLNNIPLEPWLLREIFQAMRTTENMKHLSLAGIGMKDEVGLELAAAFAENRSLESLNIESNEMTNESLEPLFNHLETHCNIREFKCAHQKAGLGSRGEEAMARAIDRNENLLKIGYPFAVPSARSVVDRSQVRNAEKQRQRRVSQEHFYNYKEEIEKRDACPQPWIKEEMEDHEVRNLKMLTEIRERKTSMARVQGSFDGRRHQAKMKAAEDAKPVMDNELANALGRARKISRHSIAHNKSKNE